MAAVSDRAERVEAVRRQFRRLGIVVYLAVVAFGLVSDLQPRVFWTMALPLLPMAIVLMGFANWRRICPLAAFGEVGTWLNRGEQRRVPAVLERWFMPFTLGLLLAMLALRLLATNGDSLWLSGLLVVLALAAVAVNAVFTGKSWCNFFCPVGVVERIYTEPNSLWNAGNSQCARCTACKRHCPDIDQENAFWRDLGSPGRRLATYAFPGLVLGFYTYYWLRAGDWEAYFDGRWTAQRVDAELVFGSGFFFLPQVPAWLAAPVSLVLAAAISFAVFDLLERGLSRWLPDADRRRHVMLAAAAFSAFSLFYFFAGAPSLRRIDGATRAVAFTAPVLATVALAKRWRRTREHFIGERGAARLLRNWPFSEPPPDDAGEVYAWIKASEQAKEQQIAAYENTVRGMITDGLVGAGELRLLEGVREQLGITQREHDRLLEQLDAEERDLFSQEAAEGVESRAQLEGYAATLTEAMLRRADADEIEALRREFGVSREDHAAVAERVRGASGGMMARANKQIERAMKIDDDRVRLAALLPGDGAAEFLMHLLRRSRRAALERALELLDIAGEHDHSEAIRAALDADDHEARMRAATALGISADEIGDLAGRLDAQIESIIDSSDPADLDALESVLERLADSRDPYVRASALWTAAGALGERAVPMLEAHLDDDNPYVAGAVERALGRLSESGQAAVARGASLEDVYAGMADIERMQLLAQVQLFADLEPADLHDLCSFTTEHSLPGGGALFREGDRDQQVFVILEGEVSVRAGVGEGDPPDAGNELAVVRAGEVLGEYSFLDHAPRDTSAFARTERIRFLRISGADLRRRLLRRPSVSQSLLTSIAGRLRLTDDRPAS